MRAWNERKFSIPPSFSSSQSSRSYPKQRIFAITRPPFYNAECWSSTNDLDLYLGGTQFESELSYFSEDFHFLDANATILVYLEVRHDHLLTNPCLLTRLLWTRLEIENCSINLEYLPNVFTCYFFLYLIYPHKCKLYCCKSSQ
jgi:hypothetical protein